MGMDAIIARIKADTDAEIARIRDDAHERAEATIDRATIEADREYERIIAEGKRTIKVFTGRILSQAVMDARRMVREERERGISLCFQEAEKELNYRIQTTEYERILRNLLKDGMEDLGADEGVIIPTERDRGVVQSILSEDPAGYGKFIVNPECVLSTGGVVIRSRDGKVTIDNTIEARIARFRNDLVYTVAKILYTEV
jgi:V/A-type H+-transporting ATPase subunit E